MSKTATFPGGGQSLHAIRDSNQRDSPNLTLLRPVQQVSSSTQGELPQSGSCPKSAKKFVGSTQFIDDGALTDVSPD